MNSAALIGIDWGTSNRRGWLFSHNGRVMATRRDKDGIARKETIGFAERLDHFVGDWPRVPTLMAGMIGSRNGWLEAPYVECPAGISDVARQTIEVADRVGTSIVPGVSCIRGDGDVMRGEETQILGIVHDHESPALAVLPGTHSKWARIAGSRIDSFRTFPTGELFAAILDNTVVGALHDGRTVTPRGFERGLSRTVESQLFLAHLFAARAEILLGRYPERECAGYLSGLLIGAEIREGLALFGHQDRIVLIGADHVVRWYVRAFAQFGVKTDQVGEDAAANGLWRIAATAELIA